MTWTVELTSRARRDLKRLDRQTQARVVTGVEKFAETGHGDVKRLLGKDDRWRLRVGSWRVIFTYVPARKVLQVVRVLPRGKAYKR